MNNRFTYNFETKSIIGTKTAISRANKGLNPEYKELTDMLAAHPDFAVTEKIINHKKDKKTYNALTFDRMEEYIKTQPDSEKNLVMFETIKKVAKARGAMYPLTKKWFLKTYPEFKKNKIELKENKVTTQITDEANALLNAIEKEVA